MLSTSACSMDIHKWIAASVMICIGISSATEPDWSCDFEDDKCGIIEVAGTWIRNGSDGMGNLQIDWPEDGTQGDMASFSIPYNFTSPKGNLFFQYFLYGTEDSILTVTVCRDDDVPAFTVGGITAQLYNETVPFSCGDETKVEIRFNATRGEAKLAFRVHDIQIFQMPTAVTLDPTQTELSTISSTNAFSTRNHSTTAAEASPPSPERQGTSWLIPVVASLVVLLVFILVVLVVFNCHRRKKHPGISTTETNSSAEPTSKDRRYPDHEYTGVVYQFPNSAHPGSDELKKTEIYHLADDVSDIKDGNLVKNPVYLGSDPVPARGEDGRNQSLTDNPLYSGTDFEQPQSEPTDDLVDNPLYEDRKDKPRGKGCNLTANNGFMEDAGLQHHAKGSVCYALPKKGTRDM